ncbi:hypothetical protein WICMUC_003926 [Wickerhamomyces mucosus]|uniref:NAD(P)-binding domain-containing protein n=1 Tax=Wickerhamomyces mucosus TaxID=1378264 RepID=A0A9P8PIU2_9ASCO|nr:hypothetical protein WICMUC_003926 [Wickerhamomyces mucosus]
MVSKVAIIGANGGVATHLIKRLAKLSNEFEPVAFIRNESQIAKFQDIGVKYSLDIDITNSTVEEISKSLIGFDSVVFSAGAGGKGLDLTFSVDLDGAIKVSEAVKLNKIKRFILVSAIKSQDRSFWWDTKLRSYYIAKKYADEIISNDKEIPWTIVQPGHLLNEESTGKIYDPRKVDELAIKAQKDGKLNISRDDVALTIVESLKNDKTIHQFIPLIEGDIPIKEALNQL